MTLGRIETSKRKRSDTEGFNEEKKTKYTKGTSENRREYEEIRKDSSINHYETDYDIKCEPSLNHWTIQSLLQNQERIIW